LACGKKGRNAEYDQSCRPPRLFSHKETIRARIGDVNREAEVTGLGFVVPSWEIPDVSKDADTREKCVNQACCQCGYRDETGSGIDPINALQPLCRHLQVMDRTEPGQKTTQRLNMDRTDTLLGLGKVFRGFFGHFDQFYDLHKVMCFW